MILVSNPRLWVILEVRVLSVEASVKQVSFKMFPKELTESYFLCGREESSRGLANNGRRS